jgi:hypothetical protein
MMWISLASPIWAKSGSWDMASIWTGYVGITGTFTIQSRREGNGLLDVKKGLARARPFNNR